MVNQSLMNGKPVAGVLLSGEVVHCRPVYPAELRPLIGDSTCCPRLVTTRKDQLRFVKGLVPLALLKQGQLLAFTKQIQKTYPYLAHEDSGGATHRGW